MDRPRADRAVNRTDLLSGCGLIGLAGVFTVGAWGYGLGSFARMGPGFFPFAFGVLGILLGVAVTLGAIFRPTREEGRVRWRPLLFVCAAVVAFAVAIEVAGLAPAVFISALLASSADPTTRPRGALLLAAGLAAGTWLLFVVLLGLPIPVFAGLR